MLIIKFFLRSSSSRSVSAMLNACRVSPGHEVRPWSYHTMDSVYSLRGKAGNHFQLLVIELLSGSHGLVVLSSVWKTTCNEMTSSNKSKTRVWCFSCLSSLVSYRTTTNGYFLLVCNLIIKIL